MTRKHRQMESEKSGRTWVGSTLPFDYEIRPPASETPRELIVLLHGFAESGARILRKLAPALPEDALVLAPNGTFPMAVRTEEKGFILVHSWYFYEPKSQEYVIDMRVALEHLDHGIESLGFKGLEKRILGFSQGGYLAPFAAQRLGNVSQVIGLACEFLPEELQGPLDFRVDHVHGTDDEIVAHAGARASHDALLKKFGLQGEHRAIQGTTHKIDAATTESVRELLLRD